MPNRLCVRSKILIVFLSLIAVDIILLFFLEQHAGNELLRNQKSYTETTTPYSLFTTIMTGNFQSGFLLISNGPYVESGSMTNVSLDILREYRNHLFMVFGISLLLGIGLTIYFARNASHPILQLSDSSGGLGTETLLKQNRMFPKCVKRQAFTEALQKMKNDILEREKEKSRQESVELTKNLASGIAHEIKNPINTVGLTVDYLQTNLSPDNPEKRYEFFKLSDNMKHELERINRIVEGFMRLTKPSVFNFKHEDVNSVVRDAVALFEPEIPKNKVQIHLDLDQELPMVNIDREKLNQVLSNLIINSIEAMPRGGDITIRTSRADNHTVEVSVIDSGIGIPIENLDNVFSPYFTTKKQSFGMGLSLVQNIIHRHHGRVSVKSEKGVGACFGIQFPVDLDPADLNNE